MQAIDIFREMNALQQENQLLKASIAQYQQQISQQPIMLIPVVQVHQPATVQPQVTNLLAQVQHVRPNNTETNSHRNYTEYFKSSESTKFNFRADLRKDLNGILRKLQTRKLSFANLQIDDRIRNNQPDVELKIVHPAAKIDRNVIFFNKDESRLSDLTLSFVRQLRRGLQFDKCLNSENT